MKEATLEHHVFNAAPSMQGAEETVAAELAAILGEEYPRAPRYAAHTVVLHDGPYEPAAPEGDAADWKCLHGASECVVTLVCIHVDGRRTEPVHRDDLARARAVATAALARRAAQ